MIQNNLIGLKWLVTHKTMILLVVLGEKRLQLWNDVVVALAQIVSINCLHPVMTKLYDNIYTMHR